MKKSITFVTAALLLLGLAACGETPETPETPTVSGTVLVDYQHDGGANIPTEWNDDDNAETVRKGNYTISDQTFSIEFVGKWYNSSSKQELQTKKDPTSFIRSCSELVPTKVVIETFKADLKVYKTNNMTGDEVSGTKVTAVHEDGDAYEYALNSKDWSVLAFETYKGSSVNIYSLTFYF